MHSRRDEPCPGGCLHVHSYTDDGTRWCWRGVSPAEARDTALDVERRRTPPPTLLARLTTDEDFHLAWTRLEVEAKLTDVSVLLLLGEGRLGAPAPDDITVRHLEWDGHVACVGRRHR